MRYAVMTGPGALEYRDVELPSPGPGEAVIRVCATAICTWEYRTWTGGQSNQFPLIGGHEVAGEVVAVGASGNSVAIGDRVAIGPAPCGRCHWCRSGNDRACKSSTPEIEYGDAHGPGGFAELRGSPVAGLYNIGDAPFAEGCLAEPLSCALHGVRLLDVGVGEDAVVIGAGVMGLLNVVALKQYGTRVIVVETDRQRLAAASAFGADELVDAANHDARETVSRLTDGRGAQHVVVAVSGKAPLEEAYQMSAERGRVLVFASSHPAAAIEVNGNDIHNRERAIIGTIRADVRDFYAASRLIRYRLVDLSALVERTFAFDHLTGALDAAAEPYKYRMVVTP